MKNIAICICLLICNYDESFAQHKSKIMFETITAILSGTADGVIYLIPVKVNIKNSNLTWLGYSTESTLRNYCKKQYGWNDEEYIKQMRSILLDDKVLGTVEEDFLAKNKLIPLSECECLYEENADALKQRVIKENFYKLSDNRFSCFVYKCFKNDIILASIETRIVYMELSPNAEKQ